MKKYIFLFTFILFIITGCSNYISENFNYETKEKAPSEYGYGFSKIKNYSDLTSKMTKSKMIYEINGTIDLQNNPLIIPSNSILRFTKGSKIINGSITFSETFLDGFPEFKNITFSTSGKITNLKPYLSWFGLSTDAETEKNNNKNADLLMSIFKIINGTLYIDGYYPVGKKVTISTSIALIGADWKESYFSQDYNTTYTPANGFYTVNRTTLFDLNEYNSEGKCIAAGGLSLAGIRLYGFPEDYTKQYYYADQGEFVRFYTNDITYKTIGIMFASLEYTGSLGYVYNCEIEGFSFGIRGIGGFLEKIQNTTFINNRFGIFTVWTSDFDIYACKFINHAPNVKLAPFADATEDMNHLRHTGAGIFLEGIGMVFVQSCYFDNNFNDINLVEGNEILNIEDNEFHNPTYSNIYIYNDATNLNGSPFNGLVGADLDHPPLTCTSICKNTFIRTKNAKSNGIIAIRERARTSGNEVFSGMDFTFCDNEVIDTRTSVPANEAFFTISNEISDNGLIISSNNNYHKSRANYFVNVIDGSYGKFTIKSTNDKFDNFQKTSVYNDKSNAINIE